MTMWPMLLDMSRDECKRILRRLELEAYGSLVSALRAQGELGKDKRKLLQDLAFTLNISMERHRAEIRRAVNDEKLATIAEHIAGPNTSTEWAIEGRRLIPLMPRLVPQTAFTALANNVANIAAAENAKLPPPANTIKKNLPIDETCEVSMSEGAKIPQQSISPIASNMSSIQQKKDEEDEKSRKRRRSSSVEGSGIVQPPSPTLPPPKVPNISIQQQPPPARTVAFPMGVTPVKITLTTTSGRSAVTTTTSSSTTQKVIIVSSSTAAGSPSILQRSLSVPIVKTVSATCSSNTVSQQPRGASLIINNQTSSTMGAPLHPGPGGMGNIVTISTNPDSGGNLTATTVSIGGIPTTAYITSQGGVPKIRPKSVQLPAKPRPRSGSIVIPMTPNQLTGGPGGVTQTLTNLPSVQGVQLKTALHSSKSSLHIKQDSTGMKIMPMSSVGSATKILPKPSFSSSGQAPVYVMSATTASVSMVTRTVPASTAPRIMTVNTTSSSGPSPPSSHIRPAVSTTFITKNNPKPIQAMHISAQNSGIARPAGGKPNVIVVQKGSATGFSRGVTLSHGGKEVVGKVIMSKSLTSANLPSSPLTTVTMQKPATVIQSSGSSGNGQQALNLPVSSTQGNVIVLDLSQEQFAKNSVLAEILQASGILSDSGSSSESATISMSETPAKAASSEWIQIDTEEKHAPIEVEINEPPKEETAQNSAPPLEAISKAPVGEMSLPVDMAGGRVVTLEEAVELLGQSGTAETRVLLSQAGIQVADTVPTSSTGTPTVQNACNTNLHRVVQQDIGDSGSHEVMEVIGELDPQTGIYSIHQPGAAAGREAIDSGRDTSSSAVRIVPTSSASSTMDIFSTALASADINLDSFQYIEDGMEPSETTDHGSNGGISDCSHQSKQVLHYTQSSMVVESLNKQSNQLNEQVLESGIADHFSSFLQPGTGDSTAVTVEPSNMDTSGMHIEDFTSQKVQGQDIT
ncbi:BRCA2-interacting transcriptional repressor EMSY isoform X4 [Zootermopsis nevadensis]|nr:BRCA2-interacting transcriptional repressor EMSY isoform X4 [Zootermopsis nevadensis]XP_021935382.1 BRCA2-interacting transcriptional repressor EMSY isoform X4 [Zootermopsis nevadensis]XP_021935383.1 BRCA2-interacting transcriptional repressor EMSY isoform X4 [Zootermopsis nevadensis]